MNQMIKLLDAVEIDGIQGSLQKVSEVQKAIQCSLKKDQDYGEIPGTQKPTLLKPGAEKILMMLGLKSEYEIITQIEDWQKGVFSYTIRCILSHRDEKITEGLGSCNSLEDKYRYRWVRGTELPDTVNRENLKVKVSDYGEKYDKYRIENDEIYSQVNTILKMAKKRAQIDAVLTVASLSEIFTQDLEDMRDFQKSERMQSVNEQNAGSIKLNFGKYKGMTINEIKGLDLNYLEWVSKNAKDPSVKKAATISLNQKHSQDVNQKQDKTVEKSQDQEDGWEKFNQLTEDDIPF